MLYFDFSELALSCLYSFLFGLFAAGIYASLSVINGYTVLLLRLPFSALFARSREVPDISKKEGARHVGLWTEIFDFIFFTVVGIAFILLLYVSLDGIPRIHFFILSLLGFFLSRATMGRFFTAAFDLILSNLYRFCYFALYIAFAPVRYIAKALGQLCMPIIHRLYRATLSYRYKRMLKVKIRNTKKLLNKLCNPANIFF